MSKIIKLLLVVWLLLLTSCNPIYTYKLKIYMQDGSIQYNSYNGYHNVDPSHNDLYLINSCIRRGNEDVLCGVRNFEIIDKIENNE